MIMIKAMGRFLLLLVLCSMLVYAPEIFHAVSGPYSVALPERILLRIVLSTDSESAQLIHKAVNAYAKDHPSVHLRMVQLSEQQLSELPAPYPDVIICAPALASRLPAGFTPVPDSSMPLCVFLQERLPAASAAFASYIIEAAQSAASEI